MKAKILTAFTKDFNKYKVNMTKAAYAEDEKEKAFTFSFSVTKDKRVTALLEYLTKAKTDKYQFFLEKITYDPEKFRYYGELKAVLR